MKTYHEKTGELIENPDLEAGYTYLSRRETGREPEHFAVMDGTDGLRRRIPETILYEECLLYHAYTAEELAEKKAPSQLDRVEAQAAYTAMMTGTLLEV